jgi:hypothetical protein
MDHHVSHSAIFFPCSERRKSWFCNQKKMDNLSPALNFNVRLEPISLTYVFTSTIKSRLKDTYQTSPKDGISPEARGHLSHAMSLWHWALRCQSCARTWCTQERLTAARLLLSTCGCTRPPTSACIFPQLLLYEEVTVLHKWTIKWITNSSLLDEQSKTVVFCSSCPCPRPLIQVLQSNGKFTYLIWQAGILP